MLRAYAKYMRQGGTPFAQDYIEEALKNFKAKKFCTFLDVDFKGFVDDGKSGRAIAEPHRQPTRRIGHPSAANLVRSVRSAAGPLPRARPAVCRTAESSAHAGPFAGPVPPATAAPSASAA